MTIPVGYDQTFSGLICQHFITYPDCKHILIKNNFFISIYFTKRFHAEEI